jgi:3-phosphoinositide dependent protein kinase-1
LKDLIKNCRGSLGVNLTRFYAMEIINGLEYLNKHNIVHRDLKPQNLLIDETFHLKIADFGAAKIIDNQEEIEQYLEEYNVSDVSEDENSIDDDSSDCQSFLEKFSVARERSRHKVGQITHL